MKSRVVGAVIDYDGCLGHEAIVAFMKAYQDELANLVAQKKPEPDIKQFKQNKFSELKSVLRDANPQLINDILTKSSGADELFVMCGSNRQSLTVELVHTIRRKNNLSWQSLQLFAEILQEEATKRNMSTKVSFLPYTLIDSLRYDPSSKDLSHTEAGKKFFAEEYVKKVGREIPETAQLESDQKSVNKDVKQVRMSYKTHEEKTDKTTGRVSEVEIQVDKPLSIEEISSGSQSEDKGLLVWTYSHLLAMLRNDCQIQILFYEDGYDTISLTSQMLEECVKRDKSFPFNIQDISFCQYIQNSALIGSPGYEVRKTELEYVDDVTNRRLPLTMSRASLEACVGHANLLVKTLESLPPIDPKNLELMKKGLEDINNLYAGLKNKQFYHNDDIKPILANLAMIEELLNNRIVKAINAKLSDTKANLSETEKDKLNNFCKLYGYGPMAGITLCQFSTVDASKIQKSSSLLASNWDEFHQMMAAALKAQFITKKGKDRHQAAKLSDALRYIPAAQQAHDNAQVSRTRKFFMFGKTQPKEQVSKMLEPTSPEDILAGAQEKWKPYDNQSSFQRQQGQLIEINVWKG